VKLIDVIRLIIMVACVGGLIVLRLYIRKLRKVADKIIHTNNKVHEDFRIFLVSQQIIAQAIGLVEESLASVMTYDHVFRRKIIFDREDIVVYITSVVSSGRGNIDIGHSSRSEAFAKEVSRILNKDGKFRVKFKIKLENKDRPRKIVELNGRKTVPMNFME